MGAEGIWIPLALSALSAGANYYNTRQTQKKQDNILAGQIRQQGVRQQEADQAIAEAMRERAAQGAESERSAIGSQYLDQVRAAQANAQRGLGQVGQVSRAYQVDANNAALGIGDYGARTADLMARIDAPAQQRQREGTADARVAMELDQIGRRSRADDYLAQLRLRGVQRNPWVDLASGLMSAGAGFAAQSGGGQSLAGIQTQAKLGADFGNANATLGNSNIANLMAGWREGNTGRALGALANKQWGF